MQWSSTTFKRAAGTLEFEVLVPGLRTYDPADHGKEMSSNRVRFHAFRSIYEARFVVSVDSDFKASILRRDQMRKLAPASQLASSQRASEKRAALQLWISKSIAPRCHSRR